MTFYGFLADVLVVIHALWVLVVVLGLVAILAGRLFRWQWVRNFWFRMIHLAMIGLVVVEALLGIPCPLTVWEAQLRHAAGEAVRGGSFMGSLVHDLLFFDWPPWVFTTLYCVFGGVVLLTMVLLPPRLPARLRGSQAQ